MPSTQKNSFKTNNEDSQINQLCRDKKFREAIYVLCGQKRLKEAIKLLESDCPSIEVYSTLIQLCLHQRALEEGKRVHDHIKQSCIVPGVYMSNRLLTMYCKCGSLVDAQKLFDEMGQWDLCSWNIMVSGYSNVGQLKEAREMFDSMPERDNFSWTAMISGYVRHNRPKEALRLYRLIQMHGSTVCNKFTVSSALSAAASLHCLRLGKEIHGHIMRKGLDSDVVVWRSLSDMYGKCGSLDESRHIFDRTSDRDVVSWTAMINRYFEDGRFPEGFALFSDLLKSGVKPNEFTFSGVLNACACQTTENLVGRFMVT